MRNEGALLLLAFCSLVMHPSRGDKIAEFLPSEIVSPLAAVLVIEATARNGRHFMLTK